ncbi:MAG: TraB/GumN family protein [Sphingosinicella sp.]|uniref:TraB/GumN family protein n=1 Tax=Sphingosinicella sp. TaxID=1917971 RepID=UPI0040384477
MKKLLLAALLAFAPAPAFAQEAAPAQPPAAAPAQAPAAALPDADPALWVVRDEDTTIYLFGTFHLLDGRPWFNDEVRTAFDASNELVVEVMLPEDPAAQQALMQPLLMRLAIDPQGRTVSSRLTPEQNARLNQALATLGVPAGALDRFEPWFVSLTLAQVAARQLNLNAANGPEAVLRRAATERNMTQGELETMESQLMIFDTLSEEDQLRTLRAALDDLEELSRMLAPMLEAWSTGNVDRLSAMLTDGLAEDRTLYDALFTHRNARWGELFAWRMARPGTLFMAVGAGHLGGPNSVQDALQGRGIRAERVPHVEAPAS